MARQLVNAALKHGPVDVRREDLFFQQRLVEGPELRRLGDAGPESFFQLPFLCMNETDGRKPMFDLALKKR